MVVAAADAAAGTTFNRHQLISLAPNQEGAVMSPNNRHLNPRFPGIGNTKWRQAVKGNVRQIKFNCK